MEHLIVPSSVFVAKKYVLWKHRTWLQRLDGIIIERERKQELQNRGSLQRGHKITHFLHPQHPLILDSGADYVCDACHKSGHGMRFCCRACNFDLHSACAVSKESFDLLTANTTDFQTITHGHPLKLVRGTSEFTCTRCNNTSTSLYRYQCDGGKFLFWDCHDQVDLVCATNPTVLESFLHPNHGLLELKTRPLFRDCGVCNKSGKINARAYTCTECDFFVHPQCAQLSQYLKDHPLHPTIEGNEKGHILIFREIPDGQRVICTACGVVCEHWRYTCAVCTQVPVNFHHGCLVNHYRKEGDSWEDFKAKLLTKLAKKVAKELLISTLTQGLLSDPS